MDRGRCAISARILVLEDCEELRCSLVRLISRYASPAPAGTVREARELLAKGPWHGLIVDVRLPDGSGLDLLAGARSTYPTVPALVITEWITAETANFAFDLGAQYVTKPLTNRRIEQFLEGACRESRSEKTAEAWKRRSGLSPAELDVLVLALQGYNREAIAAARKSSPETIKKHVTHMLRKTGHLSLNDALVQFLKEAAGA